MIYAADKWLHSEKYRKIKLKTERKYLELSRPGKINVAAMDGKKIALPDKLQTPALELTEEELKMSIYVFRQSLIQLRKTFAQSQVYIAYLPSPATSYDVISPKVSSQSYEKRADIFDSGFMYSRSQKICDAVRSISLENAHGFIDFRPHVRRVTTKSMVHGPRDWKHFNQKGQTVLGEAISSFLQNPKKFTNCDPLNKSS